MTGAPDRAPAPASPQAPPWWQRAVARFAPELGGARGWAWYRRQVGGRWCLARLYSYDTDSRGAAVAVIYGEMWVRVMACPRPTRVGSRVYRGLFLAEREPWPLGLEAEAIHRVNEDGTCSCEVYPEAG